MKNGQISNIAEIKAWLSSAITHEKIFKAKILTPEELSLGIVQIEKMMVSGRIEKNNPFAVEAIWDGKWLLSLIEIPQPDDGYEFKLLGFRLRLEILMTIAQDDFISLN
ncbi:MAG: hypothetical protein AB1403_18960 [Candidatus Riflebacteria bacterium]